MLTSTQQGLVVEWLVVDLRRMVSEVFQNRLLKEKVDQLILKVATLESSLIGTICEQYMNKEDGVDESHLLPVDFDSWIDPLARQLGIDLNLLMERIKPRNLDSHCDIRSAPKQSAFLKTIPSIAESLLNSNFLFSPAASIPSFTTRPIKDCDLRVSGLHCLHVAKSGD